MSVAARPGRARACGAARARGPSTPDAAPRSEPPRAAEGPATVLGEERSADTSEGSFDIAPDERRIEPNHAIVGGACERRIMPRISVRPIGMILAIDLESLRGGVEGRDEAPEQRHLATKY